MNGVQQKFYDQGLVRPRSGRVFAGVCAGLARRFGLGAGVTRLLFLITLIVIPGSQILVYPLLWLLMPSETAPVSGYGTPPLR